jgi:catalase
MTTDQYGLADELVEMIYRDFGGFHSGYRGVHALGRYYAGSFTATPEAAIISRAAHFQGAATPATIRFSSSPFSQPWGPARSVSMATKFYLASGLTTNLVALPFPVFFARTPEETLELLRAGQPDPETRRPNLDRVMAFVSSRPWIANALQEARKLQAAKSFSTTAFNALHAFRFINTDGVVTVGRYTWEPDAGRDGQDLADLQKLPSSNLFEELEDRLRSGPVSYSLMLQIAQPEDPTHDPTLAWPTSRERRAVGKLEVTRTTTVEEIGDPVMMHDPTVLTDGIQLSDDPVLSARRGIYEASVAGRTGGWKGKSAALQREGATCPFSGGMGASH